MIEPLGGRLRGEPLLLLAVADEDELHATIAAAAQLAGDVQQGVEPVGRTVGAGEAGEKIIRSESRQGAGAAEAGVEDLEVAAVRDHDHALTRG